MTAVNTATRTNRTLTNVEWAVYELAENGDPDGGYYPYPSRSAARKARDEMNAEAGRVQYGVFRRQVSVTRD